MIKSDSLKGQHQHN